MHLPLLQLVTLLFMFLAYDAEASTDCFSVHLFGSGTNRMDICISDHGNLVQFTSPTEHIRVQGIGEGYAVCSDNGNVVHGYDAGVNDNDPWLGDPVITQPNGPNTFPLKVSRTTSDGAFQLTHSFARSTNDKTVTITMVLKNVSAAAVHNVELVRYFDGDINDTAADNLAARFTDSLFIAEAPQYGLLLTAGSPTIPHTTRLENATDFFSQTSQGCVPSSNTTTGPDYAGRLTYQLGTINPGKSKTSKVVYKRF